MTLSEKIATLPDWARAFIHDLETRCDPAGDVQRVADLQEQLQAVTRRVTELEDICAAEGVAT